MELRSGSTLRSEPPLGARGRCRARIRPDCDADEADHISGLPDDLLHQILVRLRCARAAAHTSLLARRWRGLWRHLPELTFRDIAPGALDTALAQVARAELCLLEIDVPERHRYSATGVALLLRTAARLAPVVLSVVVRGEMKDHDIPVEVPIFNRTTSLKLNVQNLCLIPPAQGGEFTVLEKLSISGCKIDNGLLVSQCPCLRALELCHCWRLGIGIIMVHSTTIEELVVDGNGWEGVDIVAPRLKKFTMNTYMGRDFNISFVAPIVKDLRWDWLCDFRNIGLSEMGCLLWLNLWMQESVCSLHLVMDMGIDKACLQNCPCDQLQDWRNENICLMALENVEITNLEGSGHEIDFLKLLFRCAPLMKRMTVILPPEVLPSNRGCKEICDIFKANPSVKCNLYSSSLDQVVHA